MHTYIYRKNNIWDENKSKVLNKCFNIKFKYNDKLIGEDTNPTKDELKLSIGLNFPWTIHENNSSNNRNNKRNINQTI